MSDEDEERAGTAALEAGDVLRIVAVERRNGSGGAVVIQWAGVDGRRYSVSRATRMAGDFEVVATNVIGVSPVTSHTDHPPHSGPVFYRVETR